MERKMKKRFRCEVDCANCAAKIEDAIRGIDGVQDVTLNFIAQKLTIVADDDKFDEILKSAVAKARKIEPDATIFVE